MRKVIVLLIGLFGLSACTIDISWPEGFSINESNQEAQLVNQNEQENAKVVADEDSVEADSESIEADFEDFGCGNNICDEDVASCCVDCGCDEGEYCTEDNICKEVLKFKSLPLEAKKLFEDKKKFSPMVPMATMKPMIATMKIVPQAGQVISQREHGGVGRPSIYTNKIVFHEYEGSDPNVWIYDTITKQIDKIPYDGKSNEPNVGAGVIVWTDYSRGFTDNSDIYYYNFSKNEQGYISPRNNNQNNPKTFGNSIVWSEQIDDMGGRALNLLWIPSREETRIYYKKNKTLNSYEIWGGSVVFSITDCSDMDNCFSELCHYSIATKKNTILLTTAKEDIHSVSIWDNKISYIAGDTNKFLYSYDLDTKLTNKLTNVISKKYDTATYMDVVVWADKRDGDYEIFLYDLVEQEETKLTDNNKDDRYPDIFGKNVVFQNGNSNIVLIEIN